MDIAIRPYINSDSGVLNTITGTECQEILRGFDKANIYIAEWGGAVAGWYYLSVPSDPLYSCYIFIYITPESRKKGIGTALYHDAETKMISSGHNWWTSYPVSDDADRFALSVGFDYTNHNSYMEYEGGIINCPDDGIRQYRDSDYPVAPDIWSEEYANMHIRLGLPYNKSEKTTEWCESERTDYINNASRTYVLEQNTQIIGIGSLFDDGGIGSLAIDSRYINRGYGTKLAVFLTNECIRRGSKKPYLYCETNNTAAFLLYKKIGYREISRENVAIKQNRR